MRAITPLLLVAAACLPGCIVQDIHDEIALSNTNLGKIEGQLVSIDGNLDTVNQQVSSLQDQLNQTNTKLNDLQAQLNATNEHLASLRKTINNIDSTIPFLKLSGDDDEAKEALESDGQQQPPAAEPDPAKDPAGE
jgi:septal ring factor EnvC (AmiA/AmiB activator)